jgi:peptidoglycan/xylan/chitin deacetylase (PgdA/CDA1 family)
MPLNHPAGKHLAVCLTPDFDAHSVWIGTFENHSPSLLSRGEFGAEVGVPRLLKLFAQHGISTTFCIPTHTMQTFRAATDAIMAAGHSIAAHGVYHERVPSLDPQEERRLMELQIAQHEHLIGRRPRGYRSPAFDFSAATLGLLEEFDFVWDSSLMGRDFSPYHPRPVLSVDREAGNTFGPPSPVVEIPVTWFLDDFPALETFPRGGAPGATETVLQRWEDHFDFAYHRGGDVVTIAVHPQTIGRAHAFLMLEGFVEHVQRHDGAYFTGLDDVAAAYVA